MTNFRWTLGRGEPLSSARDSGGHLLFSFLYTKPVRGDYIPILRLKNNLSEMPKLGLDTPEADSRLRAQERSSGNRGQGAWTSCSQRLLSRVLRQQSWPGCAGKRRSLKPIQPPCLVSPLRDPLSHSPAPSWELPCLLGAVASISHLVAHFIFTKPSEVSAISGLIFTDEDTEARRG